MAETFDVIVLGVGGMGAATCLQLAARGLRVLGLEQFHLVHDRGSSHGDSRMIRQAYFEHPDYVPLLFRAYELWADLERVTGKTLFHRTGVVISGKDDGEAVPGARLSASQHHLTIENLTPESGMSRWSAFQFPQDHSIVFEPAAGLLLVEECIRSQVNQARQLGAILQENEPVTSWSSNGKTVIVKTENEEYHAAQLVITAGPWASRCLQNLGVRLEVLRKFVAWFSIRSGEYRADRGVPSFFFDLLPYGTFYGFPSLDGRTIKMAEHSGGQPVDDPGQVDRTVQSSDLEKLVIVLGNHLPGIVPTLVRHSVCMYTATPDRHFIVDLHPDWKNVAIACGFSGHGYKFASVIGEVLADL
ncbi:MAG: N-methyl-L-tryptophan oxidase, partial [Planctomycetes bacterium]|nr:N-methyl-L-tryptophan oxidase [Planctomycetota bacterium]